jgi:predicted ester cyclase
MSQENVDVVIALEKAWDSNQVDDIDKYFADDYLSHAGIPGMPATLDAFKMAHQMSLSAMPDRKVEILDTMTDGDKVMVRSVMTGTNTGGFPWFGVGPNGAKVQADVISVYRVEEGKVAEHWAVIDAMAILVQIGAFSPPPMPS